MANYLIRLLLTLCLSCILSLELAIPPAMALDVSELPIVTAGDAIFIVDTADAISISNEGELNQNFQDLAENTGTEVRMVAVRRQGYDEALESFTEKLFAQWYPTPETSANQVLVVLDTLSNRATIRTGEALKTSLADEVAQSIASETMLAPLRDGSKYNQAFLDGSNRLTAILSGQADPGAPTIEETLDTKGTFTKAEDTDQGSATVWVVVLLLLATVIPMVTYFWYVGLPGR
jgi:uncharacterized protein